MAVQFPLINPEIMSIGPLSLRWYGLMYALGFLLGWALLRARLSALPRLNTDQLSDLLFYLMCGVIMGGRIGYMTLYQPTLWLSDPLFVMRLWEPGMAFHGGLIGVLCAITYFSKRHHYSFLSVTDYIVPAVPIGLGLGRLGNFINGELWGRVTDAPWGMVFPHADEQVRHPTQLYEAGFEGLVLFVILWQLSKSPKKTGFISAAFLILYAVIRFSIEFFRVPDAHLGFLALGWMTMGQLLCLPMLICGIILMHKACRAQGISNETIS